MELDDFQGPQLELKDFNLEDFKQGFNMSPAAASQLAAGEVVLDNDLNPDKYISTKEQLMSPEGREAFILRQEERRLEIVSSLEKELSEILTDPTIPVEQKTEYVNNVKSSKTNYTPSRVDLIVEQALQAEARIDESETESTSRLEFTDMISEVNKYKRQATADINAYRASKNPTAMSTAVDIAEFLVPFGEWLNANQMYDDLVGGDADLMGNQYEGLFKVLHKLPYNKRAELTDMLIKYVDEHGTVIFPDGNDLVSLNVLEQIMIHEDYGNVERWIDNVLGVIEFTGLLKAPKMLAKSRAAAKATVHDLSPTAVAEVVKEANPELARKMTKMIEADETGDTAEAVLGATKEDALARAHLPEPELEDGIAEFKVLQYGEFVQEPDEIKLLRKADGRTYLSQSERTKVENAVVNDFKNIKGMVPHKETMTVKTNLDGSFSLNMIYSPKDSGFNTAAEALENAKYEFRHYGLTEDNFTLYRRSGDKWIITTPKLLEARASLRESMLAKGEVPPKEIKDIDYAVGVKYDYYFRPEDLDVYEALNTGKLFGLLPTNILDRLPPGLMVKTKQGSLTQNLLDAASVLHPQIVNPAAVASDRGVALKKAYVDLFADFAKDYAGMDTQRRVLMTNYIHKANEDGIKMTYSDLVERGFNSDEIRTLKKWRFANDVMFKATNNDMAKTLRNRGYKVFTHSGSDTRLLVKPMKRGSVGVRTQYYDVASGTVKQASSKEELDKLYEAGGTYAELSEPIKHEGEWVSIVRVDDTKDQGYLRAISEDERVLTYRDGYYPIMYDANFFIYKTIKGKDGVTFEKTVGSAKTKEEAERLRNLLQKDDPEAVVDYRADRRVDQERSTGFDEAGWSLGVSSGVSSQRLRGERLLDATGGMNREHYANLVDPLEAVTAQIMTMSDRVSFRNYLDTTKKRWVENYAEKLNLEKDRSGNYRFPSSIEQVKGTGSADPQMVADARSIFNYITGLENGYINGIDYGFKALMNFGADMVSNLPFKKPETVLRDLANTKLTSASKGAVFKMYLAANPQRQLIIQSHQAIQLGAINPAYQAKMPYDLYRLGRVMRGAVDDAEAVDMYKELKRSGMLDAVDANNLVRQDGMRLADLSTWQKTKTVANAPLKSMQIVGFDTAEQFVLVTSWLSHRDMAVKAGKKLDRTTYDEIAGQARAFTLGMNRAGDMPYNTNTLNVIAQFLQVPHKAILQPLTNRTLTPKQRGQLAAWNLVMYGVPSGLVGTMLYDSVEPGFLRESIENGLEFALLNELASFATGENQSIDWGDLSPTDVHGMHEFALALVTGDIGQLVSEAPAVSLIAGQNPRLTDFMKTVARWGHLVDDYDDQELDTKFTDVARSFGSLFSGWSNAAKTYYAFQADKKVSSLGNITDPEVTEFEAAMQFFGFRTKEEEGRRKVAEALFKKGGAQFEKGDVAIWYTELKRQLARKGMSVRDRDMAQRILGEGLRVFESDPISFQKSLLTMIQNDIKKDGYNVFDTILKQSGNMTRDDLLELVEKLPESKNKDIVRESINRLGED